MHCLGKKTSSFHYLFRIVLLLPPLRPALVRFHSAFQLLIRLQIIQTDHLIAAGHWAFLLRKSIGAEHLFYSFRRERMLTNGPETEQP
jgi:hypothetical protein